MEVAVDASGQWVMNSFDAALRENLPGALPIALPGALDAALEAALAPILQALQPLAKLSRMVTIMHNQNCATGDEVLEIVLLPSGQDPTKPPHNLPALDSPRAIRDLSAANRDMYYQGYYPGGHARVDKRIELICIAIGSRL
ncbi:hypothetical protein BD779DRAFT_664056 [Infundibulicybe gibba]|nr:hypothetical protein BD779DRAFT_664056 [Infundibulicybe gibba]